jgi:FkbM family methyltransferase
MRAPIFVQPLLWSRRFGVVLAVLVGLLCLIFATSGGVSVRTHSTTLRTPPLAAPDNVIGVAPASTAGAASAHSATSTIVRITATVTIPFDMVVRTFPVETVSSLLLSSGGYAPVESAVVDAVLRGACRASTSSGNAPLVLDVGANQGYFTLLAASHGCRVRAYEPNTRLCSILAASVALNGFSDRVTIVNAGVGSKPGVLRFDQNAESPALARVLPDTPASAHMPAIPIVRLDDEVHEDVLLMKMDTEGFETEALGGAQQACSTFTFKHIVIEIKKPSETETLKRLWSCLDASAKHAGLGGPVRAMWFREWYSSSEVAEFRALGSRIDSVLSYGYETPHGYLNRHQSPHDFRMEDAWYSLEGLGWEALSG